MAAEKSDAEERLSPRRNRGMANGVGVELLRGFGLVDGGMHRAAACRAAGALFRDGGETLLSAVGAHHAHHAMVLAVAAAAGRETRFGIGSEEGRNQHPTEDEHQRK